MPQPEPLPREELPEEAAGLTGLDLEVLREVNADVGPAYWREHPSVYIVLDDVIYRGVPAGGWDAGGDNTRSAHIITIEDPIEYLHRHKQSLISQRELATDTGSYVTALRASLRQAPDVFPPAQQQQIRIQLAQVLKTVISQQLLHATGGRMVPAFEIMHLNNAVRTLVRDSRIHQIDSVIQISADEVWADKSLFARYQSVLGVGGSTSGDGGFDSETGRDAGWRVQPAFIFCFAHIHEKR